MPKKYVKARCVCANRCQYLWIDNTTMIASYSYGVWCFYEKSQKCEQGEILGYLEDDKELQKLMLYNEIMKNKKGK